MSTVLNNIRIVLCETQHPGNIGAAARAMKTMGLSQLYLVSPRRFPDKEAEARASNAVDVLRQVNVCTNIDEALAGVVLAAACTTRSRDIAAPAVNAREAAAHLIAVARSQPIALVFGNEVCGLSTDQVKHCQMVATIPAEPSHSSLNLAAAVQVFAYELRMCAVGGTIIDKPRELASHEETEGFYVHLEQELFATGYLNPKQPKRLMQRLRRLYARARLEREEVNILRGIVRTLREPKKRT
jgi:tRNA/rRNA methyltransferase